MASEADLILEYTCIFIILFSNAIFIAYDNGWSASKVFAEENLTAITVIVIIITQCVFVELFF
jgi:hypothetical protein